MSGDAPKKPTCALGRVINIPHDEDAMRWKLWKTYRVLVVNIDDDRLTAEQRNGARSVGNALYGDGWKHE